MRKAFLHHDGTLPETSALGYGRPNSLRQEERQKDRQGTANISRLAISDIMQLLPTIDVIQLLVNNYFDKIHWFILVFHQREFRESLVSFGPEPPTTSGKVGYVSVLLAVCAISLRYTNGTQQQELEKHDVDVNALRERILTTLRLRVLDILTLGSLEAVQLCVLLGSYYLYHGEPELAWPLCGCALRLAQALDLHRRPEGSDVSQREVADRKRCWWAVHEMETLCSMMYGFPLTFSDADCDVNPLDPKDPWSLAADGQPSASGEPTLLVYKCSMSALSEMVKSALQELYASRQKHAREPGRQGTTRGRPQITQKIKSLDTLLVQWYESLPTKLKMKKLSISATSSASVVTSFEDKLFRLQALALKIAFENARILIHRPLLSYKASASHATDLTTTRTCRDAALEISWAGHTPIFREATTTYALNFIALHLLTAGVTLCILASLSPLSQEAFDSKMGIRRLMEMQASLRSTSIVADQGLQILRRLLSLVMKKETNSFLELGPQSDGSPAATTSLPHSDPAAGQTCDLPDSQHDASSSDHIRPFLPETTQPADCFDMCPDVPLSQSMLDIEQGTTISYVARGVEYGTNTAFIAFMFPWSTASQEAQPDFNAAFASEYSSIGQDQVWMWDPLLEIGHLD